MLSARKKRRAPHVDLHWSLCDEWGAVRCGGKPLLFLEEAALKTRPLLKLRVRRFLGLFWPIFDANCGGNIDNSIPKQLGKLGIWQSRRPAFGPGFSRRRSSACEYTGAMESGPKGRDAGADKNQFFKLFEYIWPPQFASKSRLKRTRKSTEPSFRKRSTVFLVLLCLFCSVSQADSPSFETLMGLDTVARSHIMNAEDQENIRLYKNRYETIKQWLFSATPSHTGIPKVIHFLWLGTAKIPRSALDNIRSWRQKNPRWQIVLWVDKLKKTPLPGLEKKEISSLFPSPLAGCLEVLKHPAERADLLRYEILYQEGGVFVDLGMRCDKPFAPLNQTYDFYCGLQVPSRSPLTSTVLVSNRLIAAAPAHPILKRCRELILQTWPAIEEVHFEKKIQERIAHRTVSALNTAVKENLQGEGTSTSMVFPASFFYAVKSGKKTYAHQASANPWFDTKTPLEQKLDKRIDHIELNQHSLFILNGALLTLNLFAFTFLLLAAREKRASYDRAR